MRRKDKGLITILSFLTVVLLQGCINEYPSPERGNSPDKGQDPTAINANIEVSFDLNWENLLYDTAIRTKSRARNQHPHRFVIEVLKDGEAVCHDLNYLTSEEFSLGRLNHKLSIALKATNYQIAVWYDLQDDDGNYAFNTENLKEVGMLNLSTTDAEALQCAFGADNLDLTEYTDANEEIEIKKELQLNHAGARFEIVTTDINKFIETYRASLIQGDYFTAYLLFTDNTPTIFNLHSNEFSNKELLTLSGKMRFPFEEYEELKIAEGFVFCKDESEATLKLEVKNSALLPICRTEYFSFPIKRGYITTVKGDFLSSPVDGLFSINTIWD